MKSFFTFILCFIMFTDQPTKPTVLYVFDPLCGWCYGFSPVMKKLHEKYQDKVNFVPVSGGMITGTNVGPLSNRSSFIKQAIPGVESTTGIKFGDSFKKQLETGTIIFSSVPPSKALMIVKILKPEYSMDFASEVQNAIYRDGIDPDDPRSYLPYIRKYGISEDAFLQKMEEPDIMAQTEKDFRLSDSLGVSGFPTVFIIDNKKAIPLSRGFETYEKLEKKLLKHLN